MKEDKQFRFFIALSAIMWVIIVGFIVAI